MSDAARSASPTIRGYLYQFDRTILQLLAATEGQQVLVEHVEDVDLSSAEAYEATQCKYLPSKKFSFAVIREPVTLMLKAFAARDPAAVPIRFRLQIHCEGSTDAPSSVSCTDLKAILTYKPKEGERRTYEEQGWGDEFLTSFAESFQIESGPSYEAQVASVKAEIASACGCGTNDVEWLFYSNALSFVACIAASPEAKDRTLTRAEFLARINVRERLFSAWFRTLRSHKEFVGLMRSRLQDEDAFRPQSKTTIYVARHVAESITPTDLGRLISKVAVERYPVGKVLHSAKPLTFIIDGTAEYVRATKAVILGDNVRLSDGYEDIEFQPSVFEEPPVINRGTGRFASDVVSRASYAVRVISATTYHASSANLGKPRTAIVLVGDGPVPVVEAGKTIEVPVGDLAEATQILSVK